MNLIELFLFSWIPLCVVLLAGLLLIPIGLQQSIKKDVFAMFSFPVMAFGISACLNILSFFHSIPWSLIFLFPLVVLLYDFLIKKLNQITHSSELNHLSLFILGNALSNFALNFSWSGQQLKSAYEGQMLSLNQHHLFIALIFFLVQLVILIKYKKVILNEYVALLLGEKIEKKSQHFNFKVMVFLRWFNLAVIFFFSYFLGPVISMTFLVIPVLFFLNYKKPFFISFFITITYFVIFFLLGFVFAIWMDFPPSACIILAEIIGFGLISRLSR